VLQNNKLVFEKSEKTDAKLQVAFTSLINGHYLQFLKDDIISKLIFQNKEILLITENYINDSNQDLIIYLNQLLSLIEQNLNQLDLSNEIKQTYIFLIAVLFLQLFVISNFSGPKLPFDNSDIELGFIGILSINATNNQTFKAKLHSQALSLLTISGYVPYHLVDSPVFLIFSLFLFEKLQGAEISLLNASNSHIETNVLVEKSFNSNILSPSNDENSFIIGSVCWWRARALQVQQSLLPEISSELTSVSLALLNNKTINTFIDTINVNSEVNQLLLITYNLELANISIAGDLELKTLNSIINANKISRLSLVLTGCKAKMTRYQQKSTATLTILAKSHESMLRFEQIENSFNPQDVKLNDDLFLERPEYDSIGDSELLKSEEVDENDFTKRIKLDYSNTSGFEQSSSLLQKQLLPIALKDSDIPKKLSDIDPNNQPNLANLDHVQLILRMQAILNNTPSGNTLVNEELIAIIQRTLFSAANSVNWLLFARALWYRSLLETARARTVERGVLQLYSLVEELGVTSEQTARLFPKTEDEQNFPNEFRNSQDINKPLSNSIRLRYLYQIPLMPKWSMDSKLAEKLLELGAVKSALEIYERLEKWTDAALCYASTGDTNRGIELLNKALELDPKDARSWSVLGDIKNDPEFWEKAWSIGRYANAKKSLAKYYYNPPKDSGVEKDMQKAIDNMFECLSANPINFQNWYFYGCMGLDIGNHELAAEAFTRCISLDDTNSYAWSNLASALIKLGKLPEAFNALQKSVNSGDSAKKSWKIWENYMIVAVKLGKWDEVLHASIVLLNRKKDLDQKESSIDLPIMEKLVDLLISEPYDENKRESYYQKTCIDFVCNMVPSVVLHDERIWRIVAKVNLWRKKPWLALEDYEKAYRAVINNPELVTDEKIWKNAVEACLDLVSAYENFGELEGRHGAGDLVCKDWKFKAKSTIRSLISKGKSSWEYSDDYARLQEMKEEIMNL
jgi:tetratricopeptide (TPR) repeat protein